MRHGNPRPWLSMLLAAPPVIFVALFAFPLQHTAASWVNQAGLDASWRWGINFLAYLDTEVVRDVVFTYGPLGFLLQPLEIGSNVPQALVTAIVLHVIFVATLVAHTMQRRSGFPVLLFALAYANAVVLAWLSDFQLVVIVASLLMFSPRDGAVWRPAAGLGSAIASAAMFVKFSSGIMALSVVALSGFGWWAAREARARQAFGWTLGVAALSFVAVGVWRLGDPGSVGSWLTGSLELVRGYPAAMSLSSATLPVILAVVGWGVFAAMVFAYRRLDRGMMWSAIALAAGAYISFRSAFIRHGGGFFFSVTLALLGALLLRARTHAQLVPGTVAAAYFLVAGIVVSPLFTACDCRWRAQELLPSEGLRNVSTLLNLEQVRVEARKHSGELLAPDRLPPKWIDRVSTGNVDFLPFELNFAAANGLRWQPNPTLQLYAAYTQDLDARMAEHFSGGDRPRWLVVLWADIDGRHPLLSQPQTWRAILNGYRLVDNDPTRLLLLLERRDLEPVTRISTGRLEIERGWLKVPRSEGWLFARFDLQPTLSGRVRRWFWRLPPIEIRLRYTDGLKARFRILPDTIGSGLLVDPVPLNLPEAVSVFEGGRPARRVAAIRIAGPGRQYFADRMHVVWERFAGLGPRAPGTGMPAR